MITSINKDRYQVSVTNDVVSVEVSDSSFVIEVGVQGPPGAGGSTIISETAPASANEGQLWLNPTTNVVKIYSSGVWSDQTSDDGYF